MQKRAQFDDRIRNLIALAQDGSEHSRTLLFSHISDLFLQKRPMASETQIRMLTEILKELLDQVELSARKEIAAALYELPSPPEELINIMCEDVVEVSGPLLEKAILPDEKLIHIIRYGTDSHRIHVSRRFGLSPLVRRELENAFQDLQGSKQKYSLNELDKHAEDVIPDMDEEVTANILELLRAQKMHKNNFEQTVDGPIGVPKEVQESAGDLSPVIPTHFPIHQKEKEKVAGLSIINTPSEAKAPPEAKTQPETIAEGPLEQVMEEHLHSLVRSFKDKENGFPKDMAANDAVQPNRAGQFDSTVQMADISTDIDDDIWQKVQKARSETNRQREFVRTVADWFWEVDRNGLLSFISEESFVAFGRASPSLIGEDFISLCTMPDSGAADEPVTSTFEALFEHRSSFRNVPFDISSKNEEKNIWYLSAIAIFDIYTGRFAGFRGSACAETSDDHLSMTTPVIDEQPNAGLQEVALEKYINNQALKVTSQEDMAPKKTAQGAHKEDMAQELLQNLSHEFRTPLNAIIGFSEMINMETWGPVNKQYHQNIKNILTASMQMKEAVNDVLDSARLEAGLMQINPESFSLKSILMNCQENVEAMAEEYNVHLKDNDNNIDVILYNDKQSVELCLTKMLASIIKRATGGETVCPSVLINSNAQVRVELPLLGPKIDEKDAKKIFYRHSNEAKEQKIMTSSGALKYEPEISSGYGLSIAQRLAYMIGGDISVHISQGYATHLVLTLSNHDPS